MKANITRDSSGRIAAIKLYPASDEGHFGAAYYVAYKSEHCWRVDNSLTRRTATEVDSLESAIDFILLRCQ